MKKKLVTHSDACVEKTTMDKEGNFKVKAVSGYSPGVDLLFKIKNTGDGYKCTYRSYSSSHPDEVFTIGYDVFDYIGKCWLLEQKHSEFAAEIINE